MGILLLFGGGGGAMTEKSYVWNELPAAGDTVLSPYNEDVWAEIWGTLFTKDYTTQGVVSEYLSALQVTGSSSPISIGAGAALVHGTYYINTSAYTLGIGTPAGATRIDVVVLRKTWATKTIRIALVAGAEGGGVPALTQVLGNTWEIPLANVSITTGGVITVTDVRSYLPGQGFNENASICQGRLTLTSGLPVTTADVVNATTILFTPYKGNLISLYNGKWFTYEFLETPISISGLVANTMHDIFAYNNFGVMALELVAWNSPATFTVTSITNASPRVVSTTDTTGLALGDLATIYGNTDALNNATWRVGTVVVNTSFQLLNLDGTNSAASGSVGTGGNWNQKYDLTMTRATALAFQDGVYVKSGDPTRRYLGTILINDAGGSTNDSALYRFVWNYYNRITRSANLSYAGTHVYTTAVARVYNNDLTYILPFIIGVQEEDIEFNLLPRIQTVDSPPIFLSDYRVDAAATPSVISPNEFKSGVGGSGGYNSTVTTSQFYTEKETAGLHVAIPVEYGNGTGTINWLNMFASVVQKQ